MKCVILGFEAVSGPPAAMLRCPYEDVRSKWADLKRTKKSPVPGIKAWKMFNIDNALVVAETPDQDEKKGKR